MGDTGLLVSHTFDENELLEDEVYKQILASKLQINEGMLYENAIAQMLVANGQKLYYSSKKFNRERWNYMHSSIYDDKYIKIRYTHLTIRLEVDLESFVV